MKNLTSLTLALLALALTNAHANAVKTETKN